MRSALLLQAVLTLSLAHLCMAAAADPAKSGPPRSLSVHPAQVDLNGPREEQQLIVLGEYADGRHYDLTRTARYASAAAAVATVDAGGVIRPAGDGQTTVTIQAAGQTASVAVRVRHARADVPVNFSREVIPVLSKAGCNQGACHGAQHGRGGFRLSLFGFDPAFDHNQIVQSAEGRRVVLSDPERSILLLKPTLTMEHGGGERIKPQSPAYELLRRWLEDGAPEPETPEPAVARLEVWPTKRLMAPVESQQLAVRATWNDGKTIDVTGNVQYDTLNESIAAVSPAGLVTAKAAGETHIMMRYCGQVAVFQVTLPYAPGGSHPPLRGLTSPAQNFIDAKLIAKWKDLGLSPSPLCGDAEFFRRIHLDTIGTLPAPDEVKAFLADRGSDKRRRAIDRVLDRPEFVDFWALKWGDHLRIDRARLNDKGMWSFHNWVRAALRDHQPVDEFVRDIITAEGSTFTVGPANFFRTGSPAEWAENTAQLFLGVRMQCAKCHHHPFEKWSQDDYYGLAAFFVRLGTKNSQEFGIFGGERVLHLRPAGEQTHPRKGGVVQPHPLGGPTTDDPLDRRRKLAEWVTAKDNPFFARNLVNRFWGYFMGRGLVEPLDDLRATNPPTNPELLDALAKDFAGHGFDLKHLLRTVMNSRAYQLSADVAPGNRADANNVYFARHTVKRLTAEQLADALDFATGTREKYQGLPPGTRAIQLPDPAVQSFLLDVFGRPARKVTCECERTMQPNIAQALHLLNGSFLNQKIANVGGRVEKLFKAKKPLPAVVEELYLVTLSRPPSPREAQKVREMIARAPSPKEGVQDLLWVLLNSREFLFNY
jgi:hypothetical protein